MQQKPSNPVEPESLSEPFSIAASHEEPQDFLGLGESGEPGNASGPPREAGIPEDEPLLGEDVEQTLRRLTEVDPEDRSWLEEVGSEEDLEAEGTFDGGEETMSWLMELDPDEDQLVLAAEPAADEGVLEPAVPRSRRGWLGRALITVVSLSLGFAAARYLAPDERSAEPGELSTSPPVVGETGSRTVAQAPSGPAMTPPPAGSDAVEPVARGTDPSSARGPASQEGAQTLPSAGETPEGAPVAEGSPAVAPAPPPAVAGAARTGGAPAASAEGPRRAPLRRNPFGTLTRLPAAQGAEPYSPFAIATRTPPVVGSRTTRPGEGHAIESEPSAAPGEGVASPNGPEVGRERRTQVVKVEDLILLPESTNGRIREASASELAAIWSGAEIPVDAIEQPKRLLTPQVGRVRVVLGSGEIFEGRLYAVGQKQVWLETELGKMALLSYQVHRVEHILDNSGGVSLGEDGSQDLVGLERVRVRTPGGVFYGKVIARDEGSVTLVTDEGARVTLHDVVVDPAGKSATRLVDSSGAVEASEGGKESPE